MGRWDDSIKKARVPAVDRTTASKNLRAAGYDVRFRQPRPIPARSDIDEAQRKRICNILRKRLLEYWTRRVDGCS